MPDSGEPPVAVDSLDEATNGSVLQAGEEGYDEARAVWNARVDREPAAILRCTGAADVVAGVTAASEHGLPLSVKGGGHHVSGDAIVDTGLTLDLGPMDWVRVDPDAKRARVGPGATWGDVDHETTAFGLAVPGGQDPNIGVAGLTLGGGVGWLSRLHGLSCDNLCAADVVTAAGDLVHASPDEHPDLFWALRGGGGNVGVVTDFEFRLHDIGEVFAGSLVYPHEALPSVARRYDAFALEAPPEARVVLGSMVMPAASYLPRSVHDTRVAILLAFHAGPPSAGKRDLAPLRAAGEPLFDSLRTRSYVAWQEAGESRGRMRTHVRSQYLSSLTDEVIERIVASGQRAPSSGATVFASPRGGAEIEPATDATAYPHREPAHHLLAEARWNDPAGDEAHVRWVEELHEVVEPETTGAAAMNFLTADEGADRVRAAYGDNYERLVEVKRRWDPEGLFAPNASVASDG